MSDDKRDVLEVLKFELSFLEQGGYGRSVRTPWKATSVFQDSPSCLNFNDSAVVATVVAGATMIRRARMPATSVCSPTWCHPSRGTKTSLVTSFR